LGRSGTKVLKRRKLKSKYLWERPDDRWVGGSRKNSEQRRGGGGARSSSKYTSADRKESLTVKRSKRYARATKD